MIGSSRAGSDSICCTSLERSAKLLRGPKHPHFNMQFRRHSQLGCKPTRHGNWFFVDAAILVILDHPHNHHVIFPDGIRTMRCPSGSDSAGSVRQTTHNNCHKMLTTRYRVSEFTAASTGIPGNERNPAHRIDAHQRGPLASSGNLPSTAMPLLFDQPDPSRFSMMVTASTPGNMRNRRISS